MKIGARIKQLRLERGLSLEELAKLLGKNKSTVYRYETGDIESLPASVLEPLARALGVTPADFLIGYPESQPQLDARFEFSDEEKDLIVRFRQLNPDVKSRVSDLIDFELFRQEKDAKKEDLNLG